MNDLIPHQTATQIAAVFAESTKNIQRLALELGSELERLNNTFRFQASNYGAFDIELMYQHCRETRVKFTDKGMADLQEHFKRAAWRVLVNKLEIEKVMSSSERDKLRAQLNGDRKQDGSPADPLPEITEESIISVLTGFLADAPRFLEQSIRETYQWLIPHADYGAGVYKTNKKDRVGKKVILKYIVDFWNGGFGLNCRMYGKLGALDTVFHNLDGAGTLSGHNGPLVDAMRTAKSGTGETSYFRFTMHKNGNAHIEFLRQDLLDLFNAVAADNRTLGEARKGTK